jgi:hypothetical protein
MASDPHDTFIVVGGIKLESASCRLPAHISDPPIVEPARVHAVPCVDSEMKEFTLLQEFAEAAPSALLHGPNVIIRGLVAHNA